MARPGPARKLISVRLGLNGLAEVARIAKDAGVDRSEMIRILLAEAIAARQKVRR